MPNESYKPKQPPVRTALTPGPDRHGADTLPDLPLVARFAQGHDTLPDQAGVYVPPRRLVPNADHRTIEIAPVRLAQEIDPRRAMTELRLSAPLPRRSRGLWLVPVLLAAGLAAAFGWHRLAARDPAQPQALPVALPAPTPEPPPQVIPVPLPEPPPVGVAQAPAQASPPEASAATPHVASAPSVPQPRAASTASARAKNKAREPWLE